MKIERWEAKCWEDKRTPFYMDGRQLEIVCLSKKSAEEEAKKMFKMSERIKFISILPGEGVIPDKMEMGTSFGVSGTNWKFNEKYWLERPVDPA